MFNAANEARAGDTLKLLLRRNSVLSAEILDVFNMDVDERSSRGRSRVESAANLMRMLPDTIRPALDDLATSQENAAQAERLFRFTNKITRALKKPDVLGTMAMVTVGWTAETVLATVSLAADGHVDVVTAMGIGAAFSTANSGVGLATGQALRFANYRNQADNSRKGDRLVRGFGIGGVAGLLGTAALLLFTAARVRVTGSHDSVFDFTDVGVFATFNDAFAIIIAATAALSFGIAVAKGYSGFSDPILGFADHVGTAGAKIPEQAQDLVEDALEQLDDIAEAAEEDVLALWDDADEIDALVKDILDFNASIEIAKAELRVFVIRDWEEHSIVADAVLPRPEMDFSAFDALHIDPSQLSFAEPQQALIDQLRAAHAEAAAQIMTLSSAFSATTQTGVVLSPLPTPAE